MVEAYFNVITRNLSSKTEVNHEDVSQHNQFPGVYLKHLPSEYTLKVFTPETWYHVFVFDHM